MACWIFVVLGSLTALKMFVGKSKSFFNAIITLFGHYTMSLATSQHTFDENNIYFVDIHSRTVGNTDVAPTTAGTQQSDAKPRR